MRRRDLFVPDREGFAHAEAFYFETRVDRRAVEDYRRSAFEMICGGENNMTTSLSDFTLFESDSSVRIRFDPIDRNGVVPLRSPQGRGVDINPVSTKEEDSKSSRLIHFSADIVQWMADDVTLHPSWTLCTLVVRLDGIVSDRIEFAEDDDAKEEDRALFSLSRERGRSEKSKTDASTSSCVPLPEFIRGNDAMPIAMIEDALLSSTSAEMGVRGAGALAGLMAMLQPILDSILGPVGKVVGAVVGAILGPFFKADMGQNIGPQLGEFVPRLVSDALASKLPVALVGPVSETVSATLSQSVTESLRDYFSRSMKERVTVELVPRLFRTLMRTIPPETTDRTSANLARRLTTRSLSSILVRALTHAVVPALSHTVSHSPLQDYFCYYCFHFSVYCAYCHYAPIQVYYSMYYAAYYGSYYADAYSGTHVPEGGR